MYDGPRPIVSFDNIPKKQRNLQSTQRRLARRTKYVGMKNVVIITSVVEAPPGSSVFLPSERLSQLKKTVDTVKEKIPNSYVFLVNAGTIPENLKDMYDELNADHKINIELPNVHKSIGEVMLVNHLLNSQDFHRFKKENEIAKFTKVSGRYYLTEEFIFDESKEVIMKIVDPTHSWSGHGICETRYYSFSASLISEFKDSIQRILEEGIFIDIEHTFYKNRVLPIDKSTKKLHLAGFLAPTGEYVED